MTYSAAQRILKTPRFGDPEAIEARDHIAAIDNAVELLLLFPLCKWCDGTGTEWNDRERCWDLCSGCFGATVCTDHITQDFADTWDEFTEEVRKEAILIARKKRKP